MDNKLTVKEINLLLVHVDEQVEYWENRLQSMYDINKNIQSKLRSQIQNEKI